MTTKLSLQGVSRKLADREKPPEFAVKVDIISAEGDEVLVVYPTGEVRSLPKSLLVLLN